MSKMPIAFIADRKFFLPTVVAITSLLENASVPQDVYIYLIGVGFESEQKDILKKIEDKYETTIRCIDVSENELRDKYKKLEKHDCNATITALIKFDLPELCLDEDVLLYLDGDIIVKADLSALFEINMNDDTYVAAVRDSGVLYSERLKRQQVNNYFNSGVMLLNLDAMRKNDVSNKLVEAKIRMTDNSLMDQHVLNKVFDDHKILMDYKYNVLYVNLKRARLFHGITLDEISNFCGEKFMSWDDILEKAAIVHYSSFDKPWKFSDVNGGELWDCYYRKTVLNGNLKRKCLHTKTIETLMQNKITKRIGIIIWEIETKGIRRTAYEIAGILGKK